MFASARLKLTVWYLLISMSISILFSIVIYRGATMEVERSLRAQRVRLYRETHPFNVFPAPPPDPQLLAETQERIAITLLFVNVGILILAGGAGYFLAGRTLQPIQIMVDQQNQFITDASHELRTPLTSLRSEIEVNLRDKTMTTRDARKLLLSNLEEVMRLQQLSDTLLELSQTSSPALSFAPVSLSSIIDEAIDIITPLAKKKYIHIQKNSINYKVLGEKQSLVQLFVILLDNAVKYSRKKTTVTISVNAEGHTLIISVQDRGIGIEKKDIARVFERFYRADSSRTSEHVPGYGLGLAIGKKIVETHKGSLTVMSKKNIGTTFTVTLQKST
ncbi:MAG TPA: HAMP domain-containing sensor histidine kinase [Candidatus Saccharimonadales bacterium]|nr:HAMP domain-containing sensor histidine kinase [Candidatus Saccharimonadales bacterium]